jgi:4-diphosphocytidyl-2-C-methyl-D-erythritol kinase
LSIALPARAKLNLDLSVLGRRTDGYHEVRTTLQAIDLHDLLLVATASETNLTMTGLPVKNPTNNSILQALDALERATHRHLPTRVHLHKQIPPGSGMGGASSDAATALLALAALHQLSADLPAIAKDLGADVPFFLTGGTAIADQRGDHLTHIPTQPMWFAIAWPGVELPTPDVYRAWDNVEEPPKNTPNHLTEAAMRIEPRVKEFANALNSGNPRGTWQMTGSGSAFFLRTTSEATAHQAISHLGCWTAVAQSIGRWA